MLVNQPFSVESEEKVILKQLLKTEVVGQAGALKTEFPRLLFIQSLHSLKNAGFITRDSRVVERKKYGNQSKKKFPIFKALKI